MRYALISDIHANLPALRAVLADIDARADVAATAADPPDPTLSQPARAADSASMRRCISSCETLSIS
jgi:hypothetical protein